MIWKLKNIFGIDFDLDIETMLPYQESCDFRLKHYWGKHVSNNTELSKDFIYYALCHLPEGSFIIFKTCTKSHTLFC